MLSSLSNAPAKLSCALEILLTRFPLSLQFNANRHIWSEHQLIALKPAAEVKCIRPRPNASFGKGMT